MERYSSRPRDGVFVFATRLSLAIDDQETRCDFVPCALDLVEDDMEI